MTGNSFGWLKGELTKHLLDNVKVWREIEYDRLSKEKDSNKEIFVLTRDRLKEIDSEFSEWFDKTMPDTIYWSGEEFQKVLKVLWDRIEFIKKGYADE